MIGRGVPLVLALHLGCATPEAAAPSHRTSSAAAFLDRRLVPFPETTSAGRLAMTDPETRRIAVYDSALVTLVLVRRGERAAAARVIEGLRDLQATDGSLPFSFVLGDARTRYVRSGAVAWVGYAAIDFLDADRGGPGREAATELARRAAGYLLERQVASPGDPRDGLVRGGEGTYRYELDARGALREVLHAGEISWTSVEHNVDAYFFFRALGRVTGEARWLDAANRVREGLLRTWSDPGGQLVRGRTVDGSDPMLSLDCASWGSIFLGAAGDHERAETSAAVADAGFSGRDARTGARGHRMQRRGPLVEGEVLLRVLGASLPARDWKDLEMVWPEGSAGVALAAWRSGARSRAKTILDDLEPLRARDGSLPTSTVAIPFVFDTKPSVAGTAWVELVRFELGRPPSSPTFWAP